ncbi:putative protein export protein [Neisseria meningitidis]|nr:putative protein export protein [Neisseria meningitidis]
MPHLQNLSLGLKKKLPVILQTEISECGLACLAAVAGVHGFPYGFTRTAFKILSETFAKFPKIP